MDGKRCLLPNQVQELYPCFSEAWLEKARTNGNGPIYSKVSTRQVVYLIEDLDAYIRERRVTSTSQKAPE